MKTRLLLLATYLSAHPPHPDHGLCLVSAFGMLALLVKPAWLKSAFQKLRLG